MADEEIEEEASLSNESTLRISHGSLVRNGWDVEAWPAIYEELSQRIEVTISAENLKPTLPIHAEDRIDDMIGAFGFLRIANTPILDQLELDEAFLDSELALILIELILVLEHAGGHILVIILTLDDFGHAHANAIWTNVARAENSIVLLVVEEVIAFVGDDGRHVVYSHRVSVSMDRTTPVRCGHRPLRHLGKAIVALWLLHLLRWLLLWGHQAWADSLASAVGIVALRGHLLLLL